MNDKKILFINACIRPDSRTLELAKSLLATLPGEVCELKLFEERIPPLTLESLDERTLNLQRGNTDLASLRYARQFAGADTIVIAAPYWNLMFPTELMSYLEAITATGVTFTYSEAGQPAGLCRAGQLCYVTTAGGYIGENNFGFDYVSALAKNFFNIRDVRFICAEGLDIAGADTAQIMADAKAAAGLA